MRATISNSFILFVLNNFGVYTDFQTSFTAGKKMKFHKHKVYRNSNHILNVLLHYSVICTVNIMFHAIPNDQQTVIEFIGILNTQLVDMLLMMPQIVHATRLWLGLFDLMI